MSGGSGKTTSNTVAEPPAFIQPYLKDAANQSVGIYDQGPKQYFPGSTVVPFSPQTQQALDLIQQRGTNGSPLVDQAKGYNTDVVGGSYLNSNPFANGSHAIAGNFNGSNPYLDQTFNRAADSVQQRIQSGFAGSGRNIEAGRPAAAQELNDLATNIYGGAYQQDQNRRLAAQQGDQSIASGQYGAERGYQQQASQFAPQLAATDYADLGALQGVGNQYEDLYGRQLQNDINRFDYNQNAPGAALDEYIARLTGSFPGTQQQTTAQGAGKNRIQGAAGGALAGYTATGNPYGALIGAGIGAFS